MMLTHSRRQRRWQHVDGEEGIERRARSEMPAQGDARMKDACLEAASDPLPCDWQALTTIVGCDDAGREGAVMRGGRRECGLVRSGAWDVGLFSRQRRWWWPEPSRIVLRRF